MTDRPNAPDPDRVHPIPGQERVVLLRPLLDDPLIGVGEYTYYDDPEHATEFATRNVTHHYGPDRLVIGRFCALAAGVTFVMNGANHRMSGVSTYPFPIMGAPWSDHVDLVTDLPSRGDTVVATTCGSAVVGGNPARLLRMRFDPDEVRELLDIAWWDWPIAAVTAHLRVIADGSVADLRAVAASVHH